MSLIVLLVCPALVGQNAGGPAAREHAANPIYQIVRTAGIKADGATVQLAAPSLRDGMTGEEQRAVLRELRETELELENFLAPGVSATIKSRTEVETGQTGTITGFNIWFVVHATLDEFDADELGGQAQGVKKEDKANMHFTGRLLKDEELTNLGLTPPAKMERFGQTECLLLDKVEAKLLTQSLGTRSDDSLVVATRTVHDFPAGVASPNTWRSVERRDGELVFGPWQPYAGMISYTKASRLKFLPGALLVEIHGAFSEPDGWFERRPILRGKIPLVANDKVRELRRDISRRRRKAAGPGD